MSVTFTAPVDQVTLVYRLTCDDRTVLGEYAGYQNAYLEAQVHALVCTQDLCQGYGAEVDQVIPEGDPVPLNVSNRNAMDILAALGFQVLTEDGPNLEGEEDAGTFLARVDIALALAPVDPGLVEVVVGNATDCGREPGYLQDRLLALRELALACQRAGLPVIWS